MDARRALLTQVLDQVKKALRDLSEADFDRLMQGELDVSVSFVRPKAQPQKRRLAVPPVAEEAFEGVHGRLTAAGSREEGQRIVEGAFADKKRLFAFAKYLDLPVQRNDAAKRIREKVVTHTVGRRLSGKAVRGDGGGMAAGEGGC